MSPGTVRRAPVIFSAGYELNFHTIYHFLGLNREFEIINENNFNSPGQYVLVLKRTDLFVFAACVCVIELSRVHRAIKVSIGALSPPGQVFHRVTKSSAGPPSPPPGQQAFHWAIADPAAAAAAVAGLPAGRTINGLQ